MKSTAIWIGKRALIVTSAVALGAMLDRRPTHVDFDADILPRGHMTRHISLGFTNLFARVIIQLSYVRPLTDRVDVPIQRLRVRQCSLGVPKDTAHADGSVHRHLLACGWIIYRALWFASVGAITEKLWEK